MLHTVSSRSALASLILLGLASLLPAVAHGGEEGRTYIALGDSIAWGQTNVVPVSYGDQGYVKLYADWLATQDDGDRPKVINLAIPGETSDSFFTGTMPLWYSRKVLCNHNYRSTADRQFAKFLEVVATEKAAGRRIEVVSFCLGINDVGALLSSPEWNAPGADQQALLDKTLQTIHNNWVTFLTRLRVELPHARLLLLNYYNPYEVFGTASPVNNVFRYVSDVVSASDQELAKQYKGHFVDIHTPFIGHAAEYTYILAGDIHPNASGYSIIAEQMVAGDQIAQQMVAGNQLLDALLVPGEAVELGNDEEGLDPPGVAEGRVEFGPVIVAAGLVLDEDLVDVAGVAAGDVAEAFLLGVDAWGLVVGAGAEVADDPGEGDTGHGAGVGKKGVGRKKGAKEKKGVRYSARGQYSKDKKRTRNGDGTECHVDR